MRQSRKCCCLWGHRQLQAHAHHEMARYSAISTVRQTDHSYATSFRCPSWQPESVPLLYTASHRMYARINDSCTVWYFFTLACFSCILGAHISSIGGRHVFTCTCTRVACHGCTRPTVCIQWGGFLLRSLVTMVVGRGSTPLVHWHDHDPSDRSF